MDPIGTLEESICGFNQLTNIKGNVVILQLQTSH